MLLPKGCPRLGVATRLRSRRLSVNSTLHPNRSPRLSRWRARQPFLENRNYRGESAGLRARSCRQMVPCCSTSFSSRMQHRGTGRLLNALQTRDRVLCFACIVLVRIRAFTLGNQHGTPFQVPIDVAGRSRLSEDVPSPIPFTAGVLRTYSIGCSCLLLAIDIVCCSHALPSSHLGRSVIPEVCLVAASWVELSRHGGRGIRGAGHASGSCFWARSRAVLSQSSAPQNPDMYRQPAIWCGR